MSDHHSTCSDRSLERSCTPHRPDSLRPGGEAGGVQLLQAWLGRVAFAPHRHDTYAIGVTDSGVQVFDYRGATRHSQPGQVVVLHPDESHDGRAGDRRGFSYRIAYITPQAVGEAVACLCGAPRPLPFVADAVLDCAAMRRALSNAFVAPLDDLAADALVLDLAGGLLQAERGGPARQRRPRLDRAAMARARDYLHANAARTVRGDELQTVTGLDRYQTARQFRHCFGTSPHRFVLMRRLDMARRQLTGPATLAQLALDCGFADQPHMTRMFKAAFGLTPACYRRLQQRTGPTARHADRPT